MFTYDEFVKELANTNYLKGNQPVGFQRAGNETCRLAYKVMLKKFGSPSMVEEEESSRKVLSLKLQITELEQKLAQKQIACEKLENAVMDLERTVKNANRSYEFKQMQAMEANILKANENITACETAEGRDTMRTAQCFVNSIKVDTKYDNTAFIIGLSAILSKGGVSPLHELEKMNPDIEEAIADIKEWTVVGKPKRR